MIEQLSYVKVVLFVEEEIGCRGSSQADLTFFTDCRWIIQIDRKESSDIITKISGRDICSKEFKKDICKLGKELGFTPTSGMMTDVDELTTRNVGVSCINLSCGYYFPHTSDECTVIAELENTINFCQKAAESLLMRYPHIAEKKYLNDIIDYDMWWDNRKNDSDWKKDSRGYWHGKKGGSITTYYPGVKNTITAVNKTATKLNSSIPCNYCKNHYDCLDCNYYKSGFRNNNSFEDDI